MKFTPTTEIVSRATRVQSSAAFFGMFPAAWESVRCQVLKLETRQHYVEEDSASWRAFMAGDRAEALVLLPSSRQDDVALYASLAQRRIDFVRCRPLTFPLSSYLQWEFEVYKFNAAHGERIFCCNRASIDSLFDLEARHDFLVFDARIAFIHDYDESGLIKGGWWTTKSDDIRALIALHGYIKANCQSFEVFAQ